MELDTWVSIGTLLGVGLVLYATTRQGLKDLRDELRAEMAAARADTAALRTEFKADIARLETELRSDIARLDDRVYALAAGLRPQIEQSQLPPEAS